MENPAWYYVRMYIHICVCCFYSIRTTYVHVLYVHPYMFLCIRMYVRMHEHYVRTYVRMSTYVCTLLYVNVLLQPFPFYVVNVCIFFLLCSVVFTGFSAEALKERIVDCTCVAVLWILRSSLFCYAAYNVCL